MPVRTVTTRHKLFPKRLGIAPSRAAGTIYPALPAQETGLFDADKQRVLVWFRLQQFHSCLTEHGYKQAAEKCGEATSRDPRQAPQLRLLGWKTGYTNFGTVLESDVSSQNQQERGGGHCAPEKKTLHHGAHANLFHGFLRQARADQKQRDGKSNLAQTA